MAGEVLAVTLSVEQLRELMRAAVREELENHSGPKEILVISEAAEFLQMHPKVLSKKAAAGEIPAHKFGPEWRFLRSELLAHIAGKKVA